MKNKRKVIIFAIALLIFIGIFAISILSNPEHNITELGQNPPIKSPEISTFYPNKGIKYNIDVSSFNPPNELPLIKVNPPRSLTEEEVIKIAKTAGLEEDFNKVFNSNGDRLYIFNSNNAYLTIYADKGELSYKSYAKLSSTDKKLSDEEIISKAKDFLADKFSFRKDTLNVSSINHFNNEDYLTKPGSNQPLGYFEVNFAPVITDYKIVTQNPDQSPIKVTVADDGTIGKADITLVYRASLSPERYAIGSFKDIKDQIDSAVIVSAYTENLHGQTFPTDSITSVDIEKIEIAYFTGTSYNSVYYQPIFLMEGTGKSSKAASPIKVTLYLPALKK